MEIIKFFQVNAFMSLAKFPHLTIWLFCNRRPFQIFTQFGRLFKETNIKSWGFYIQKRKGEKKYECLRGHRKKKKKRET